MSLKTTGKHINSIVFYIQSRQIYDFLTNKQKVF